MQSLKRDMQVITIREFIVWLENLVARAEKLAAKQNGKKSEKFRLGQ